MLMTTQAMIALSTAGAQSGATAAPAAQGGGPTACSIINAEELKRLTGLKDLLGKGPVATDPSEVPKGVRAGSYRLVIMDMTSSDSVETVKPQLLAVAKATAPKLR